MRHGKGHWKHVRIQNTRFAIPENGFLQIQLDLLDLLDWRFLTKSEAKDGVAAKDCEEQAQKARS